jgi:ketosteroid isomerase-like protein
MNVTYLEKNMNQASNPKRRSILSAISLGLVVAAAQIGMMGEAPAATPASSKAQTVDTSHVETYFKALSKKDKQGIGPHMAPNIVLLGPIFPEPTNGKEAVVQVLSGFLDTIDTLEVNRTFASGRDVAVFFSFSVNGINVKGNEHLHVNEKGLIDSIEVAWRPLPAAVAVQEIFAQKLGFEAMRLVPAKDLDAASHK